MPSWGKLYGWILSAGGIVILAAVALSRIELIREPFEHNYAEGIILYQILHVLPPSDAYRPITAYPYIVFHYTPLYHLVAKLIGRSALGSFYTARTISFVSTLALGALCAAFVLLGVAKSRLERAVLYGAALGAAAFALESESVLTCAAAIRSDMMGIALAVLGLYVFVRFGTRRTALWISLLLFIAAIYCKQTLIAAPAACLSALWFISRRTFANAVGFLLLVGGTILAAMEWLTGGEFVRHIFLYNANPFSAGQAADAIFHHVVNALAVVTCALVALFGILTVFYQHRSHIGLLLARSARARVLFCTAVFAVAGAILSLSSGKLGASTNYFLEWDASFAVLTGIFMASVFRPNQFAAPSLKQGLAVMASLAAFLMAAHFVYRSFIPSAFMQQRSRKMEASYAQLVPWIHDQSSAVLSEDMTLLVMAGKVIPMEPAIFYCLRSMGRWDEEPFVERIRHREFAAVIAIHDLNDVFTQEMTQAIRDHYCEAARVGDYHVYREMPDCLPLAARPGDPPEHP